MNIEMYAWITGAPFPRLSTLDINKKTNG